MSTSAPDRALARGASALPAPAASRLRPPSWRDPRLVIGVLLVLASVAVGARVVASADDTTGYWVSTGVLTPGDPVTVADVRAEQVRLEDGAAYLPASRPLPQDLVAVRPVGAGELLPADALGPARDVALQPVGVPVTGVLASGLVEGARVDVWVARPDPDRPGSFLAPVRVVDAAVVAEVSDDTGALGASSGATVQVLLDADALPEVLGALANDAEVSLVLAPGGS